MHEFPGLDWRGEILLGLKPMRSRRAQ